ncbi:hypothetical protein IW261DRAFT_1645903 [Armillaria novae-zelandiae]|uniref:Uncharacterized protein n=1 Tax=Armillaria novae-zelandiae TaxID=153914 RepID=A0AA39P1B0_9AGAR|nr:hypothetical protein IW261DRAFT_1645903 [Armillaria novae-zelandiae]
MSRPTETFLQHSSAHRPGLSTRPANIDAYRQLTDTYRQLTGSVMSNGSRKRTRSGVSDTSEHPTTRYRPNSTQSTPSEPSMSYLGSTRIPSSSMGDRQGGRLESVRRDFPPNGHFLANKSQSERPSYYDLLHEVENLRASHQQRQPTVLPTDCIFDPAVAALFGHATGDNLGQEHTNIPEYDPTIVNLPWEVKHNLRNGMPYFPCLTSFSLEACQEDHATATPLGPWERQQYFVGAGGTLEFSVSPHKAAPEDSIKTYGEWLNLTILMTQGLKDNLDLGDGVRGPRARTFIIGITTHWRHLMKIPRAKELFPVIRAYDSGFRQHIFNNGNIGSWKFSHAAWDSHLTDFFNETLAAKARVADSDAKLIALQGECRYYKSQSGGHRQRNLTTNRTNTKPRRRRPATVINADYICMVCGGKGVHSFGSCPNTARNNIIELRNQKWAANAHPVASVMPVGAAAPPPMELTPTVNDLFPIATPFHRETWTFCLTKVDVLTEFKDISRGIREGSLMGLENYKLDRTSIPRNHYTLPAHHDFLVKK